MPRKRRAHRRQRIARKTTASGAHFSSGRLFTFERKYGLPIWTGRMGGELLRPEKKLRRWRIDVSNAREITHGAGEIAGSPTGEALGVNCGARRLLGLSRPQSASGSYILTGRMRP